MAKKDEIEAEVTPTEETPIPEGSRAKRWKEFLATAEAQAEKNGTKHIFDADVERGAFKTIPDSFV